MNYTFSGVLTEKEVKQHLLHPFEVPAQATGLEIVLQFSPARVNNISNMLCLTLFDPLGFRGAGHRGGNIHRVQIDGAQATPGYQPGPLPSGQWTVEIDTHMIMPGEPCTYQLEIVIRTSPDMPPVQSRSDVLRRDTPAGRGPGWYRGDLHAHTRHSDGDYEVRGLVETARQRRLDFITLTDHNTVSGLAEMEQLADTGLLTLVGLELTTFWGHAVCLGRRTWLDWRVGLGRQTMADLAHEVTAAGQLFIIAHPCAVGDPWCTGCDWRYEEMKPGSGHFVEIWNGPWGGDSNNEQALSLWYGWLNEGHRLVATAGSDAHRPEDYAPTQASNVVYAQDLTEAALFQGLKEGHLYLSTGPHLTLSAATRAGEQAMMGDTLASEEASFTVEWQDCPSTATLRAVAGGTTLLEWPAGQGGSRSWTPAAQANWCLVEVRGQNGEMLAVTNPIFLGR